VCGNFEVVRFLSSCGCWLLCVVFWLLLFMVVWVLSVRVSWYGVFMFWL